MGLERFKEYINEEGLPGSKLLLQFHQDARAYGNLVDEVQVGPRILDQQFLANFPRL